MRRPAPRMATIVAAALAAALALPAAAMAAQPAASTDTEAKVKQLESQLTGLRQDRIAAQQAADQAHVRYEDAVATLSAAQISAEQTQEELAQAKADLAAASDTLANAARSQYRDTSASLKWMGPFLSADGLGDALEQAAAYHQYSAAGARAVEEYQVAAQRVDVAAQRAADAVETNRTAATHYEKAADQATQALADANAAEQSAISQRDALIAELARLKAEDEAAERARQDAADKAAGLAAAAKATPAAGGSTPQEAPASGTGSSPAAKPTKAPAPTQAPQPQPQPTKEPAKPPTPSQPDGPAISGYNEANVPAAYRSWVRKAGSVCSGVPPAVIAAQIQTESSWNPKAVSGVGAQGLSQFMPGTWTAWGQDDDGNGTISPFDPGDAIMAQGRYMCALYAQMSRYLDQGRVNGNNLDLALASYNIGAYATLSRGGITPGTGAERYVTKIRSLAASRYT